MMVRAMSYGKRINKQLEYDYFDINRVLIGGRVVNEPKITHTPKGDEVLNFMLAYRKGSKSCYLPVSLIENVESGCRSIKRGSYLLLDGHLNERHTVENEGEEGEYQLTETNLLAKAYQFIPAFGATLPEIYDAADEYTSY